MKKHVFIFGAGYSGQAIAQQLASEAAFIGGTTREAENLGKLRAKGIKPFLYGGQGLTPEIRRTLKETTHLIVSIAPTESGDPVLADLRQAGVLPAMQWIGYLSTVGVYGDHGCSWVDEGSDCHPVSARSRRRLETEKAWAAFAGQAETPAAILRLSGIYGPGRNAFVNLAKGTARRIIKPGQVFNRVHVEDIAGATRHLILENAGGVFNVTDDEPSPPQDVVAYAAELMGVAPPPEIPFEESDLGPMGRSFYSECKKASNARLKRLGYTPRYPNYRIALSAMWRTGNWKGNPAANML